MKKHRIRIFLAALAAGWLAAGCMNISAPKKITVGGGSGETGKFRKADAYLAAENVARQEGLNVKNYNLSDQKTDDGWWVLFDHKVTGYKLGWPYHFAVHVTQDGKTTLFTDRKETVSEE